MGLGSRKVTQVLSWAPVAILGGVATWLVVFPDQGCEIPYHIGAKATTVSRKIEEPGDNISSEPAPQEDPPSRSVRQEESPSEPAPRKDPLSRSIRQEESASEPAPRWDPDGDRQAKLPRAVISGSHAKAPILSPYGAVQLNITCRHVVYLKNGHRLEGKIVSADFEGISFHAADSGELRRISAEKILRVTTEDAEQAGAPERSSSSSSSTDKNREQMLRDAKASAQKSKKKWNKFQRDKPRR